MLVTVTAAAHMSINQPGSSRIGAGDFWLAPVCARGLVSAVMSNMRKTSKALSYWLRHAPEAGAIELDAAGWADASAVMAALDRAGLPTSRDALERVVAESDK